MSTTATIKMMKIIKFPTKRIMIVQYNFSFSPDILMLLPNTLRQAAFQNVAKVANLKNSMPILTNTFFWVGNL
jgi:hypothetical protein